MKKHIIHLDIRKRMIKDNIYFFKKGFLSFSKQIVKWYLYKIISADSSRYLSLLNYKGEIMKIIFNLKGGKEQPANNLYGK